MTSENIPSDSSEPTISEEAEAQVEEGAAPPLNREQRRAQAKGKKSSGGAINPAIPHNSNMRGPGRSSGQPGQVRFPRTGHK